MDNYVDQILSYWEGKPLEGAKTIIKKYGFPQEATMSRLIWYNNGPWKRTIVHRDSVPHNFPTPHPDFLEQTVEYRVPIHLFDEIAAFDGSVYPDRTKGEASAMCHKEAMNFLSLNLLHDIVTGKRDVQGAKMFYAQTAYMYSKQKVSSPLLMLFKNVQMLTVLFVRGLTDIMSLITLKKGKDASIMPAITSGATEDVPQKI